MSVEFQYKKDIFEALNESQEGLLLSISIDNFFLFLIEKKNFSPENIMISLQKSLCNETSSKSFRLTYNAFIILNNKLTKGSIIAFLEKICSIMENFIVSKVDNPIYVTYSIGYKYFNKLKFPESVESILDKSIIALHTATIKKNIKLCNYDEELSLGITKFYEQMLKISYLRYAILSHNLKLAFQPVISNKESKVIFYESLLRISVNKGEIISAGDFVQATENFGFISKVDKIVFAMVVKELSEHSQVNLSINISSYSLENNDFLIFCNQLLKDKKISNRLIIEITETGFQTNYVQINKFIDDMRKIGCKIAIDDFGSGYTSIKQLSLLSIDYIKIDGSFVQNLKNSKKNQFIISFILKIADSLGVKTIAEFVDEVDTVNILQKIGIDYMQGNYFSPAEIRKFWLENKIDFYK